MIFTRTLDLEKLLQKKSFFLFGPRATGKTFLIDKQLKNSSIIIDLLQSDLYVRLTANPSELEAIVDLYPDKNIVIDEVQMAPNLLNEVHRLIEKKGTTFLLTGSSARKLKKNHANLLAGRAWVANLFPLTYPEIPDFDLQKYLLFGGLPPVYQSLEPQEELHAYVNTYLKEEIQAEALVRNIPAFSRFLQTAALTSSTLINFSAVASDTGIPASTIREYYQILEDTFIGFLVTPWQKSKKRKAINTAKFYFSDIGIKNTLAQITALDKKTDLFGLTFEHFIALELRAFISYKRLHKELTFWQTTYGHEVDFIVGDELAVEVKASEHITNKHLKNLKYLAEENICKKYYLISQDKLNRKIDNIIIYNWQDFLNDLWNNKIIID